MEGVTSRGDTRRHGERWLRLLPLVLLALATVVALATGPATGALSPAPRLVAQLVLVVVTAAWLGRHLARPPAATDGRGIAAHFVVRSALALALTLLNPLFCIFAWIGFLDAADAFRGRGQVAAFGVVAFTMAAGQSGGFPPGSWSGLALFVVLFALNLGLAHMLSRYAQQTARTSDERAAAISGLEQANADLERALAENAALQDTVVAQARDAGVQEERRRLAGEIHDTIAQSLAGILAQLQAVQEGDAEDADRRLDRATELAREALVEARRSVLALSPTRLSRNSLEEAVSALVEDWSAHHRPRIAVVVTGDSRPLHPEVEATLLRVAQEALANVARHADAHRVGVTLTYLDEEVALDVRDDGVGFDRSHAGRSDSFGLRGMRGRAERLAGVLDVESTPGSGTAVSVRLPAVEGRVA